MERLHTGTGPFRHGLLIGIVAAVVPAAVGVAVALGAFDEQKNSKAVVYPNASEAKAKCRGSDHVNFGGFKTNTEGDPLGTGPLVWPGAMGPDGNDTDKWSVLGTTNSFQGGRVTSFAYCKGGKEPKVKRKTEIVPPTAAGEEVRYATATCPGDKNVIGGGWSALTGNPVDQRRLALMSLERTSNSKWRVGIVNETGGSATLNAIALCGNGRAPTEVSEEVDVDEGHSATATAKCPQGKEAMFGGVRGEANVNSTINAFIFSFFRSSERNMRAVGVHNPVAPDLDQISQLEVTAYCR